eukprot:jgi/Botrbrau1/3286/Bobra.174_1s0051.2
MAVPVATAEGSDGRPSVSDVIATTMQKRPAMMLGLPMVNDTGVSRVAQPITVYRSSETASVESETAHSSLAKSEGESKLPQKGIEHHGGDVMQNSTVYLIFYGSWDCNNVTDCPSNRHTPQLVIDFIQSINGTSWMGTASSYYSKKGAGLSNNVNWGGHTFVLKDDPDGCFLGNELDDSNIFDIVTCSITAQKLKTQVNGRFKPIDPNGIYFVITTADVNETSGFCDFYCGWHSNAAFHKQNIRYSFVGSPLQCPKGCMQLQKSSPNNIPEADGLVSILAHELIETVSDPDGDAWYDAKGQENADKCAWNYGHIKQVGNTYYNVGPWKCPPDMGASDYCINDGRKWLIQTNWVNDGDKGYCAANYP